MSEEYGSDYITISDGEGNDFELEHLDTLEYNDELYMSFLPADLDETEETPEMIILKVIEENGEEIFSTLDSEEELAAVYEKFMAQLFKDSDELVTVTDSPLLTKKPASTEYFEDEDSSEDYLDENPNEPD